MICSENIYGFIHIGIMNNYKEILIDQLKSIKRYGLEKATKNVYLGSSGHISAEQKIEIEKLVSSILTHTNVNYEVKNMKLEDGENETIKFLHKKSQELPDSKFWYIHTKGASKTPGSDIAKMSRSWRKYMEYFVIQKWMNCVEELKIHDVCGIEWYNHPQLKWIFAGNFWWANTNYLQRIKNPIVKYNIENRMKAECFIAQANPKVKSFANLAQNKFEYFKHFILHMNSYKLC